jgi:hypothetical protein
MTKAKMAFDGRENSSLVRISKLDTFEVILNAINLPESTVKYSFCSFVQVVQNNANHLLL